MSVDPKEIAKFDQQAASWWDRNGPSRALHDLNPQRLEFMRERMTLKGSSLLDLGCGGGILSEALADAGATVTAIDLSSEQIDIARLHALEAGIDIDYRKVSSHVLCEQHREQFDAIACMEMLEHVPEPESILADCRALLKPGGKLFLSTINRNARSFALAIVGAEHLLRLLPKGTHRYNLFLKPSELAKGLRNNGFELRALEGLHYEPFSRRAWRNTDVAVNYLAFAERVE
ncbi:MAG: bifunctional 2-polyprenyl-6-hydroxyphenol methylase/3-demethylubiquinol 3-O-methyltransferase UbiG [Pseudomonadota bacterium]|nr:bifunctional 2-polyprenyl-6-hydroxyphenol methylase/3-demethylubiquinol 3-O-methyltransferase UbiG [Pseudomonadota bacterium]